MTTDTEYPNSEGTVISFIAGASLQKSIGSYILEYSYRVSFPTNTHRLLQERTQIIKTIPPRERVKLFFKVTCYGVSSISQHVLYTFPASTIVCLLYQQKINSILITITVCGKNFST